MSDYPIKSPRKLIEVALPLDAINLACAREKSIRHGHPSTLHLWWALRPLAAARAVIFAQLVNDPGYQQGGGFKYGVNKKDAAIERKRLFKIIEDLVLWENTTNEEVLEPARAEIRRSWREVCELNKDHPQAAELFNPDKLPALHDPFAGGGAIPLEAQRLGLEAYASDLNPVAVLINKAMIEIPPKFAGRPPVSLTRRHEDTKGDKDNKEFLRGFVPSCEKSSWPGATGLAEDVRYYGAWMREEAQKRIGHLYPKVKVVREKDGSYRHATDEEIAHEATKHTKEENSSSENLRAFVPSCETKIEELTVIACLWARTVKSPNPAFSHVDVPLVSTFILGSKVGKEAYIQPIVDGDRYRFTVRMGAPPREAIEGTKATGRGANFRCVVSETVVGGDYIKEQAQAGRMGQRLMALVAEGPRGRIYLPPTAEIEAVAESATPAWRPDVEFFQQALGFRVGNYGMTKWSDIFTARQMLSLNTFGALVREASLLVLADALVTGLGDDAAGIEEGGSGAKAYAESVSLYLAFALSRSADRGSTICSWDSSPKMEALRNTFGRQAIPMIWDFAEGNPLSESSGNWLNNVEFGAKAVSKLPAISKGFASQADAQSQGVSNQKFVSTDPPYYDNIGYADLSDFFYVWLRNSLRPIFPILLSTITVPKTEELVATPSRHGSKEKAESFFLNGMTQAMHRLAAQSHPASPITIYYAFKQSDTQDADGTSSTGWVTFLEAVHRAGLQLSGTWPMRTELSNRMRGSESNALASSIVLVCRKRPADAPSISRREFIRELNGVLPDALDNMTRGSFTQESSHEATKNTKGSPNSSSSLRAFVPSCETSPVAPVDLSQAIIGPGMAVFSKYTAVLEADGSSMSVRTALQLINRFLAEDDFDPDTQFCLHWFEQNGWNEGVFGSADVLARSKSTSVDAMDAAGVLKSGGGKVRLLKWSEYATDWDPRTDTRLPVWEALHQLIRALKQDGEAASGALLAAIGGKAEAVRQLAYRLYTLCERLGQAEDARAYNELITSWTGIETAAASTPKPAQGELFGETL